MKQVLLHQVLSKKVPIGAEVIPGESTGRLRVFDTGVDAFDTSGLGWVTVPSYYDLSY